MELVRAMNWAVSMGRTDNVTGRMIAKEYPDFVAANALKQLELLIMNWTDGMAEKTVTYEFTNSFDAWRKLHHDQLPEIEHRKQMLTNAFNQLSKNAGLT